MRKLRPMSDRVLVRPAASPQKSGGLSVPKSQEEKPSEGVVVAAGPDAERTFTTVDPEDYYRVACPARNPNGVRVGETVIYQKYAGREVESGGEKLRLIRLDEIDCVVEDGE